MNPDSNPLPSSAPAGTPTLQTVAAWNAAERAKWTPPVHNVVGPFAPKRTGVQCPCGGEIIEDIGVFYGCGPYHDGVRCEACSSKGYVKRFMGPPEMVFPLIGPADPQSSPQA